MFKTCILSIIFALIPSSGFCIDIWHSNTTWAGQGYTAYSFTLDGGDVLEFTGGAENVSITVDVYEDNVKKDSQVLEISQIGSCEADRHQLVYLLTNAIENKPSKFVVSKASAVIEDEPVDLLAAKRISWREFVPVQIEVLSNSEIEYKQSANNKISAIENCPFLEYPISTRKYSELTYAENGKEVIMKLKHFVKHLKDEGNLTITWVKNNKNYYTICARGDENLDIGFELQGDKKIIFTSYDYIDAEKMTQEEQEAILNLVISTMRIASAFPE